MQETEFLSPQQCFIVYEKSTKKVAISLRNRLSEKSVRCTIWDEKQFSDNEARLSNFNRVLILSEKIAKEYLAAPSIKQQALNDTSFYKREGRIASIYLRDDIDYKSALQCAKETTTKLYDEIKAKFTNWFGPKLPSEQDLAVAIDELQYHPTMLALPDKSSEGNGAQEESAEGTRISTLAQNFAAMGLGYAALTELTGASIAAVGVSFAANAVLSPAVISTMISLYGYSWVQSVKDEKELKLAYLFAAARDFEVKFFDDFVNAK